MKIERWEDHNQLAEDQLVTDADGRLWKVTKFRDETWLLHWSDEYAFCMGGDRSGGVYALGETATFPLTTVKLVADDEPAVILPPCEVCGFDTWPVGGMHAARSIHMRQHEREANRG